ncbi:MAG: endonuclease [Muribaculaceae bacterium]|nr:endonuclease [Muribaculaceae bacterium]
MKRFVSTRFSLLLSALALAVTALAQVPAGYYSNIIGKRDAELKTALHNLLYNHTEISDYYDLPQYFQRTDAYPRDNSRYGQWWDMYSDIPFYIPSFRGLNREHAFPKSWWGGSQQTPAYVDLNHLYPSEAAANMAKSNYPLGEVANASFDNGITRVGTPVAGQGGGAKAVFEPAREYKGDFARTYFYMVTCYQNFTWRYTYMVNQNTYPTLNNWSVQLLLKWNEEDPVSQKEIDRNNEVYKVQANRNPFIDYPELAEYIWGARKGQPFKPSTGGTTPGGEPVLITPVQDMSLDFGQVALGSSGEASLQFRGENITATTTIQIYDPAGGAAAAMFKPEVTSVAASAINSPSGVWVKIKYTPTALGSHTARLLVSDYKDGGSRGVALRGECLEKPELHDFRALPASDITPTGYTANWEDPTQGPQADVVDYYVVTRTIIGDNGSEPRQVAELAETTSLEINDHEPGTAESYHVQSSRLGFLSAPTNEITVDFSNSITAVEGDTPFGVVYEPSGLRFVCGATCYGVTIVDLSGRVIMQLESVDNGQVVQLPLGVYLITTASHTQPVKAIVRD